VFRLRWRRANGQPLSSDAVIARTSSSELEFFLPLSALAYTTAAQEGIADAATRLAGFGLASLFLLFPLPLFIANRTAGRRPDRRTWVVRANAGSPLQGEMPAGPPPPVGVSRRS